MDYLKLTPQEFERGSPAETVVFEDIVVNDTLPFGRMNVDVLFERGEMYLPKDVLRKRLHALPVGIVYLPSPQHIEEVCDSGRWGETIGRVHLEARISHFGFDKLALFQAGIIKDGPNVYTLVSSVPGNYIRQRKGQEVREWELEEGESVDLGDGDRIKFTDAGREIISFSVCMNESEPGNVEVKKPGLTPFKFH